MRVIVADESAEVRSALRVLFQHEHIELVGEASDTGSLLAQLSHHHADVLLVDWELLGADTAAAMRAVRVHAPTLRIVARSGRPELKSQALEDGVDEFVTKAEPPQQVLRAMDGVDGRVAGPARRKGEER